MTVSHASLTGAELHEPKGVASAGADTVYRANGSGSGTWTKLDYKTVGAGTTVAFSHASDATYTAITATFPYDDTLPQNTEGTQILSLSHTPKSSSHILKIEVVVPMAADGGTGDSIIALFKDSDASAMACTSTNNQSGNRLDFNTLTYVMTAGTTSAITFKVRAGGKAGNNSYVNGVNSGRLFGGALISYITVTEFKA